MVSCAQCKTPNTLDSAFCRKCGVELAPNVLAEAREELGKLVEKGSAAYEDGRIEDAAAIAEEATRTDPVNANAWALAGMVHERRGEVAKALEAYERVVELNPDSPLDRLKLAGLRGAIAERATARPDRRTPLLAGVSAAVLLACVGIVAYKLLNRAPATAETGLTASATAASDLNSIPPGQVTDGRAVGRVTNSGLLTTLEPGDVPPVGSNNPGTPDATAGSSGEGAGAYGSGSGGRSRGLPPARRDAPPTMEGSLPPMTITPNGTLPGASGTPNYPTSPPVKTAPTTPATSRNLDPDPTPQGGGGSASGGASSDAPKTKSSGPQGPGQIEIQVTDGSAGGAKGSGGRASASNGAGSGGNGAEALTRVGNAHLTGGDAARAAKAYEGALRAGADSGAVNQRLGQAYERLGKKAEAAQAYARAAASYKERIAAGKGDERTKNGLDSVNQALKVLGRG